MEWLSVTIIWYVMLFLLGLFSLPLTSRLFSKSMLDGGYAFAKTVGIICLSYGAYVMGTLKIIPFTQSGLMLIASGLIIFNLAIIVQNQTKSFLSIYKKRIIYFEELLFFCALIFWVIVRGQEPSIHGLEKFMDFGIINSITLSRFFPPTDMWLSGMHINYYYFGHLAGAVITKLTPIATSYSYNLILATIFALSVTQVFSLGITLTRVFTKSRVIVFISGIVASFIVNFAGNLHTIYTFTTGYPNEKPIPFWTILSRFNPTNYWYPNATRFIPFTIHEFPIYSYVVADLHGHVFDIPFVLLTLAFAYNFLVYKRSQGVLSAPFSIIFGFLLSIHYMTNALDGPIYLLFVSLLFLSTYKISFQFLKQLAITVVSFVLFSMPFSFFFKPFTTGIGVNCAPQFLTDIKKIGPFLFEAGNCQPSELYMFLLLWGFFLFNGLFFYIVFGKKLMTHFFKHTLEKDEIVNIFLGCLFFLGTFLIIVPEFFYIKDIYPAHFRANTMFKLGYQSFIMMGLASAITIFYLRKMFKNKKSILYYLYIGLLIPQLFLISIYPYFAIKSYYGTLQKTPQLNGIEWLKTSHPEYGEIIQYLKQNTLNQPVILEAQGDSYTDFNIVSSYTGLPTVGGWYVHEWLWRGSPDVLGGRVPDIEVIYKTGSKEAVEAIIKKYNIAFIVLGPNERQKYTPFNESNLSEIGPVIFTTTNGNATIIQTQQNMF